MNQLLRITQESEVVNLDESVIDTQYQVNITEVNNSEQILDQAAVDMTKAADAVESMMVLSDAIKDSVNRNTGETATNAEVALSSASRELSPVEDVAVGIALESIYKSMDIKMPSSLSMESSIGETALEKASKIKEQAIRILKAIIEAFKKAIEYVWDYYNHVTNASNNLFKNAVTLRKKVRLIDKEPRAKTFSGKNAPNKFKLNVDRFENLLQLVQDCRRTAIGPHVEMINKVLDEFSNVGKDDVIKKLKIVDKDGVLNNEIVKILETTYQGIFAHDNGEIFSNDDLGLGDRVDVYTTEYLPGSYVGVLALPSEAADLSKLNFRMVRDDDDHDEQGELYGVVASKTELEKYLDLIVGICDRITQFRSVEGKMKETLAKLNKASEALKKPSSELSAVERNILKNVGTMAPYIAKGIHTASFGLAVRQCQTLFSHCNASYKQYSVGT